MRRQNAGRQLMHHSINEIYRLFGKVSIRVEAQFYLKNFYQSFGFIQTSEVYLEDGIEHISMSLQL
jgi:ElaA protein